MSIQKEKFGNLLISNDVVIDVTDGKIYNSGDGIIVDNDENKISADYVAIAAKLSSLSDPFSLSSQVASNITAEATRAKAVEKALSESIDSKIYIDGISAESLSAIHIDAETYYQKVLDGTVKPNELYLLSCDDYVNCFDQRVANVADAKEAHDAVSKTVMEQYTSSNFVDLKSDQEISGYKQFVYGLDTGYRNKNVGNNCFAVGNDLTVGSYNFFYKGIDIDTTNLSAKIYLTTEQPRYPMPFCIFNGDKSKIRIMRNDVSIDLISTYNGLSSSSAAAIWNCTLANAYRDDDNQLCIDLGPTYQSDLDAVKAKMKDYMAWAFTPEEEVKKYLSGQSLADEQITMVNQYKIEYQRCGKVLRVTDDSVLEVELSAGASTGANGFVTGGYQGFTDFDYDDASLVFIDKPLLLGPSNTSTYSSINIGTLNKVMRRCSMAVGKQNVAESDFSIALGRRAKALHYCSFVWSPAKNISSVTANSFNIGMPGPLSDIHKNASKNDGADIYVIGSDNTPEHIYKYVVECLLASDDVEMKNRFKQWLGILS